MPRLFVDNLTVIDFSYACAKRGIVGASWVVDIELAGALNEQGMVFDFGHVKKTIKQFIDDCYDHKLWLSRSLPAFSLSETDGECIASWQDENGRAYMHRSPTCAIYLCEQQVELSAFQALIAHDLKPILPPNVSQVDISLREEVIDEARYCYTHGLQAHDGNCQRIAHGHRSRIHIYRNEQRDLTLEQQWASTWCDIYLATNDHVISADNSTTTLKYVAEQGEFELSLPTANVYRTDIVTTVENIASYLANACKAQHPEDSFTVHAFEGIAKGAIASA